MEKENEVLKSMQETIELLLEESSKSDKNDKCQLLIQTDTFFRNILSNINLNSPDMNRFLKSVHYFFEMSRINFKSFFNKVKTASGLAELLLLFSKCCIVNLIAPDISLMMIEIINYDNSKDESIHYFYPFIQYFFTSSIFPNSFELANGLYSLWDIIIDLSKENIFQIVFAELHQTIHLYFQSNIIENNAKFLSHIIETTQKIPESHVFTAFQFIIDLISNSKNDVLTFYIEHGGFSSINNYILTHNDNNLLKLYQFFIQICSSKQMQLQYKDKTNPIIFNCIEILRSSQTKSLKKSTLAQIFQFIKIFHKQLCPMTSESLYFICQSIDISDLESIHILFQIIHYLVFDFQYDITFALPKILNFCSYQIFIGINASELFDVFFNIDSSFQPFAPIFLTNLTKNVAKDELNNLIQKYPAFLSILEKYFNQKIFNDSFIELLLSIFIKLKDDEFYLKVMSKLLQTDISDHIFTLLNNYDSEFINQFLLSVSDMLCNSKELRDNSKKNDILNKIPSKTIPSTTISSLIQSLSGFFFDHEFDMAVLKYLRSNQFFNMTKKQITDLALAKIEQSKFHHLIFPSLLPYCESNDIKIESPYDKWICGQFAIDNWLKETNRPISEFPCICQIVNRYILPKNVSLILDRSNLLKDCFPTTFDTYPLFEFVAGLPNSQITIKLAENFHSASFWMTFFDYPKHIMRIASFANFVLDLVNDTLLLNNINVCTIKKNSWIHVVFIITDKMNTCFIYINGEEVGQANKMENNIDQLSLQFGCLLSNQIDWFIGGSIRTYSQIISNDIIKQLYLNGVSYLTRNRRLNESFIVDANSFVDLFEGFKSNPSKQTILYENSRPSISFSFLKHIKNCYNGGMDLIPVIHNKITNSNDSISDESIKNLIIFLCGVHSNERFKSFAIQLSSFYYMKPSLFDENFLNEIFNNYTETDINAISPFLFDISLYTAELRPTLISKLYGFAAQPDFDKNSRSLLLNSVFHLILYLDTELDENEFLSMMELIFKFSPNQHEITLMIMISLDYLNNFKNPTFVYDTKLFQGRIYRFLIDHLIASVDENFVDHHIIFILNPLDSLHLIKKICAVLPPKKIQLQSMLMFCLQNTDIEETWPILLRLILVSKSKKPIQFKDSIEDIFSDYKLDDESLPLFLLILGFLSIQALNMPSKFSSLWKSMITYAFSYINLITPELLGSKKMIMAILNLISFGFYFLPMTLKSAESMEDLEKAAEYSNLPEANVTEATTPNNKAAAKLMKMISKMEFSINKNYESQLKSKFSASLKALYDQEFCKNVLEGNKYDIFKKWTEFIPKRKFLLYDLFETQVFKDILRFIVTISSNFKLFTPKLNRSECLAYLTDYEPSLEKEKKITNINSAFSDEFHLELSIGLLKNSSDNLVGFDIFFISIFSFLSRLDPKFSKQFLQKFIFEILNICVTKQIMCPFLISFISRRILNEKIEFDQIVPILNFIFSIPQKSKIEFPKELLEVLLFGFNFVPQEQFSSFLSIFITKPQLIFTPSNFELPWFILMIFDKLYEIRNNYQYSDKILTIIKIFSEILKRTIKKKNEQSLKMDILNELEELIKNPYHELSPQFNQRRNEEKERYLKNFDTRLLISLKIDELNNHCISSAFNDVVKECLHISNFLSVFSKSICSIVRFHDRRMQLFELNKFLKLREVIFSKIPVKFNSTTKTVSLLSNPINPTRRFEMSPMIYSMPAFPSASKTVTSLLPKTLPCFNDILEKVLLPYLYDQLSVDFKSLEILLYHTTNPLLLSFSYHAEIDDNLLLLTILNIITNNKTNEILLLTDSSILYGVAPLKGVLIIDKSYMYFIEGLKLTIKGCSFRKNINTEMSEIIYEFYISYMNAGYFGPCYHFNGHPYLKLPLSQLISIASHLWLQMETSYELNFLLGWNFVINLDNNEVYSFMSKLLNEWVEKNLNSSPPFSRSPSALNNAKLLRTPIRDVLKLWSDNILSTSTYLLYLNKSSGRSYADFTQFMIFPWLISDYSTGVYESIPDASFRNLSLPMGQIGPDRIPRFDLFFETSNYYYGTHYMHLGVVLFYLFRVDPYCIFSIYFHHGWDDPNRMFVDLTDAYLSAAFVSQNDVKEIVPQLFICPEYLSNISNINFTLPESNDSYRKNIGNVRIATWAKNSYDFTRIVSKELESIRVSQAINNWIDLIFGYKSRGESAIEAKNVFHPLSYPVIKHSVPINSEQKGEKSSEHEEVERKATEATIINFGQCPRQLFKSPHPLKSKLEPNAHLMSEPDQAFYQKINCDVFEKSVWPINDILIADANIYVAPKNSLILNSVIGLSFIYDQSAICSYSNHVYNDTLSNLSANSKNYEVDNYEFEDTIEEDISDMGNAFRRFSLMGKSESLNQKIDYNKTAKRSSSLKRLISFRESPTNLNSNDTSNEYYMNYPVRSTVHKMYKSPDNSLLALTFKEGGFSVFSLIFEKAGLKSLKQISHFETSHRNLVESIIDCTISSIHYLIVTAACEDNGQSSCFKINRYDLGLNQLIDSINIDSPIRKIAIDDLAALIIVCGDSEIIVYSISGQLLMTLNVEKDSSIASIAVASLEEFIDRRFFMTGHSDGTVRFWQIDFTLNQIVNLKTFKLSDSIIETISISSGNDSNPAIRAAAFSSIKKEAFVFDFAGSHAKPLDSNYAFQCGICQKDFFELIEAPKICSSCGRFICSMCSAKMNEKKGFIHNMQNSKSQYLCSKCQELEEWMQP